MDDELGSFDAKSGLFQQQDKQQTQGPGPGSFQGH